MSTERCDALVVGGGPAGSSCARALRQAGLDVVVLDKSEFPRNKVCAGWITPPVMEALQIDTTDYARDHVLQPITGFSVARLGGRAHDTDYARVVSYGIRRCEFDHYLLQRSGARLRLGESLRHIERRDGQWRINDAVEAPLLIGAGGHFCPVARHLGADVGRGEVAVTAREFEFLMSSAQQDACPVLPEHPELRFCADLKGYGWIFRKGDYLNVGLGREDPEGLAAHSAAFLELLQSTGRVPADAPAAFKGHAYLLYAHHSRTVLGEGVLLAGDAAGLAYPQSGEGIRPAVESGLMAAATVIAAKGRYGPSQLEPYRARLKDRFGVAAPDAAMPERVRSFVGKQMLASRWLSRHVLLDRWFLHHHQPALEIVSRG